MVIGVLTRHPAKKLGIRCPKCGRDSCVMDSRPVETKGTIRRRRKCLNYRCKKRFTTYEIYEPLFFELEWARQFRVQLADLFQQVARRSPRKACPKATRKSSGSAPLN